MNINIVHENSVANAFANVTSRSSRDKRREEKRGLKDKRVNAPQNGAYSPVPSLVKLWYDLFLETTGKESVLIGGYIGAFVKRLFKKRGDASVIEKRMRDFFKSTYKHAKEKNFPITMFVAKFDELEAGPLLEWTTKGRPVYGELDKRKEQFQTTDDFGVGDL